MVYFNDSQTWLQQSTLLLQARPSTTRISTYYSIKKPSASRPRKAPAAAEPTQTAATAATAAPRGVLVVKTYDPVSGTCLKYKTDKAAEIGRLVGAMGRCARIMMGLKEGEGEALDKGDDVDRKDGDAPKVSKEPTGKIHGKAPAGAGGAETLGGGAGGKKKKGKR